MLSLNHEAYSVRSVTAPHQISPTHADLSITNKKTNNTQYMCLCRFCTSQSRCPHIHHTLSDASEYVMLCGAHTNDERPTTQLDTSAHHFVTHSKFRHDHESSQHQTDRRIPRLHGRVVVFVLVVVCVATPMFRLFYLAAHFPATLRPPRVSPISTDVRARTQAA